MNASEFIKYAVIVALMSPLLVFAVVSLSIETVIQLFILLLVIGLAVFSSYYFGDRGKRPSTREGSKS